MAQQFVSTGGVLPVNYGIEATNLSPKIEQGLALMQDADHIGQSYVSGFISEKGIDDLAHIAFCKFLQDPENLESVLTDLEKAHQK